MAADEIYNQVFEISTDPGKLDLDMIHGFLSEESYWAKGIAKEKVQRYITHSLNFGLYFGNRQVGYARVISDQTTIAYLGDVFILPEFRGRGLSRLLLEHIHTYPALQGLRRWILLTADAHELYKQFGWNAITEPAKWMERAGS